jgi:FtsH-binding integral membrane protein
MNQNFMTWVVLVLALAFLLGLLWFAKRLKRKLGMEPPASTMSTKLILLSIALLGGLVGSFFSPILTEQNVWARLICSLIIFFAIGVPEVFLVRGLHNKLSSVYLLDGESFPYFAAGFSSVLFLLKSH